MASRSAHRRRRALASRQGAPILAVSGASGAGKTRLLVRLIPALASAADPADPANFAQLQQTVARSDEIRERAAVFPYAIGEHSGEVRFAATGNSGATATDNRVQNYRTVIPDYFNGTTADISLPPLNLNTPVLLVVTRIVPV